VLQSVVDYVKFVLRDMHLSKDSLLDFPHGESSDSLLEHILRDVPLQTPEIEICEAISAWAAARNDDDDDDDEDKSPYATTADSTEGSQAVNAKHTALPPNGTEQTMVASSEGGGGFVDSGVPFEDEKLLHVAPKILDKVDLNFISTHDLCYVCPNLLLSVFSVGACTYHFNRTNLI
jgi:hypothetical protein